MGIAPRDKRHELSAVLEFPTGEDSNSHPVTQNKQLLM